MEDGADPHQQGPHATIVLLQGGQKGDVSRDPGQHLIFPQRQLEGEEAICHGDGLKAPRGVYVFEGN
jgi:hypothetical protein